MPEITVNMWAVLVAAAASMGIGAIWCAPSVLGKRWMKLAGMKGDTDNGSVMTYVGTFVASIVTAYVLAYVAALSNAFYKDAFMQDAISTAFWLWLGFTALRIFTHNAFEGRRFGLTLMASGYELATVMTMGLVIGLFGIA